MRLRKPASDSEIPTASMADVSFLLIIFFMITVTFAATRGLDLELPVNEDPSREIDPVESVLVVAQPDGALLVDDRPMALGDLLDYLHPKLTRNPDKPVIVRSEPEAPYGAMVAVLDELRQGKEKLGLPEEIAIALPTEREMTTWGY